MQQQTSASGRVLNDRKVINGWAFFDWANSAYALVITAAIFPAYFIAVTPDRIRIGHSYISDSTLYSYSITLAYILIVLISPTLSGIADSGGKKKFFLRMFTTVGSLACIALALYTGLNIVWGTSAFIIATIGFAGGLVFYNSYLPEIASEDQFDRVSARGFAFGYFGSVILLIVNLIVIHNYAWFGFSEEKKAVPTAFIMVGLWWLGFAQIPFNRLPKDPKMPPQANWLTKGFSELKNVWQDLRHHRNAKLFLLSFFFYNAGVQSVLYLASTFAEKELKFETTELIILILLLQLVAIGGAYLFAFVSKIKGNKFSLICMLFIWVTLCMLAYYTQDKMEFYGIATGVGMVMGGIQSLSRSTYSKLLPEDTHDNTTYFSFYDIVEKLAIISGTFSFGLAEQLTGNMRNSVLALAVFFIIGLSIIFFVKIKRKEAMAVA